MVPMSVGFDNNNVVLAGATSGGTGVDWSWSTVTASGFSFVVELGAKCFFLRQPVNRIPGKCIDCASTERHQTLRLWPVFSLRL